MARRAAGEMRAHSRNRGVGVAAVDLQLDVGVEQLEALVAADLRAGRTQQRIHDRWSLHDLLVVEQPAQARACVVQRLVEGVAIGGEAVGEHVDRNAVDRERQQDLPLVGREQCDRRR